MSEEREQNIVLPEDDYGNMGWGYDVCYLKPYSGNNPFRRALDRIFGPLSELYGQGSTLSRPRMRSRKYAEIRREYVQRLLDEEYGEGAQEAVVIEASYRY